ncbi:MAG: hypothetical protein ABSH56_35780 [Bryobacteraceae bacterium]|jgi:hypothetical protein
MSLRRWVGVGFAVALFCVSLLPESVKIRAGMSRPLHYLAHIAAFCAAYLLTASLDPDDGNTGVRRFRGSVLQNLFIATALMALGASIEFLEAWLYQNTLEVFDVIADGAGILLGILIAAMFWGRTGLSQA